MLCWEWILLMSFSWHILILSNCASIGRWSSGTRFSSQGIFLGVCFFCFHCFFSSNLYNIYPYFFQSIYFLWTKDRICTKKLKYQEKLYAFYLLFPLPLKFFKASHISKTFKSKSSTLSFPMDLGDMNICGIRQCYRSNYNIFDIAKKLSNSNNVRTLLTAGTCIISARWARQNTFTAIRELLAVVEWRTFFASRPTQKALLLWYLHKF